MNHLDHRHHHCNHRSSLNWVCIHCSGSSNSRSFKRCWTSIKQLNNHNNNKTATTTTTRIHLHTCKIPYCFFHHKMEPKISTGRNCAHGRKTGGSVFFGGRSYTVWQDVPGVATGNWKHTACFYNTELATELETQITNTLQLETQTDRVAYFYTLSHWIGNWIGNANRPHCMFLHWIGNWIGNTNYKYIAPGVFILP